MSTPTPDVSAQIQAALAAMMQQQQQPAARGRRGRGQQFAVQAVSIPVKVDTRDGSVRCYVQFGPEAAASEDTLADAIEQLWDAGFEVDAWRQSRGRDRGGRR